jgi:hypothetical protein
MANRKPAWGSIPPTGALAAIKAREAELDPPPFGGWKGEAAVPRNDPPPPAPPAFVIPAWDDEPAAELTAETDRETAAHEPERKLETEPIEPAEPEPDADASPPRVVIPKPPWAEPKAEP